MTKQRIRFYTFKELSEIIENEEESKTNYKHFGIKFDERLILSSVLYTSYQIKQNPYSLIVEKNSFDKNRLKIIDYFFMNISQRIQKGNKPITIYKDLQMNIVFIIWLNKNKIPFPRNIYEARDLFQQYTYSLKYGIKNSEFKQKEAHIRHHASIKLLQAIFNDEESFIQAGINLIKNKFEISSYETSIKDIKYSLNFYYLLFTQLADFLLEKKDYPFLLKLINQEIWVTPSKFWMNKEKQKNNLMCFNKDNKEIRSENQMIDLYEKKSSKLIYQIRYNFIKSLKLNNRNKRSKERINLAKIALKAYFMHFLAVTGMNDSTASTLEWNDEFEEEKEIQKFRNIKFRANNKTVEFRINKEFIKEFKQYLEIRKFLLNENKSNYLFFIGSEKTTKLCLQQKKGAFSSLINSSMLTIDKNLPKITSKEIRNFKINQIIKKDGLHSAIKISQSMSNTLQRNYIKESKETADNELNNYFNALNKNIFSLNTKYKEIAVGKCIDPNSPKEANKNKIYNFKPDCNQHEGCLFCDNYRINVDKIDVQKLYSLEFLINECKYIAYDKKQFNDIYSPILERISTIIKEMKLIKPEFSKQIESIKVDVYENENLTYYFENKLAMYLEAGYLK